MQQNVLERIEPFLNVDKLANVAKYVLFPTKVTYVS
jgi:hypothetical protein